MLQPETTDEDNYKKALSQGAADVAYGRVMLLGPAGVGKTCLRRGLMHLDFDPKTNSTILADVKSVKPTVNTSNQTQRVAHEGTRSLSREWLTHGWSEVTQEDEINELAQLMVLAGTIPNASSDGNRLPPIHQFNTRGSMSIPTLESLLESEVVMKAIERAMHMKKNDVHLKCQPFFHLWDCGGQPVFLEVLPIFLTARTIFLQLFNAAIDLTQPWRSVYNRRGRQFVECETNMSTLQMMERWLALICSHLLKVDETGVDPGYPRVIPIGTRGDELMHQGKKAENIKMQVKRSLKLDRAPLCHIMKQPLIIDNTTSGNKANEDPGYAKIRKEIFEFTVLKLKKETPISWILYRKLLQLLAKKSQLTNIISMDEAKAVGVLAKVHPNQIHSVLKFYHELGVLLYYPDIKGLACKVILDPKWFVESLGEVLTLPGAKEEQFEDKAEWELLRSKGILVQKLYTTVWRKCQGVKPEEFMELLVHFQIAVEVKTQEYFNKSVKQFFVPGVLPYTSSVQIAAENSAIKAATLHIIFDGGFAIPGFFTRLSTALLKQEKSNHPQLELYFKKGIYHNQVTYRGKMNFKPYLLTLTEKADFIEVTFFCFSKPQWLQDEIQKCCIKLKALCEASCKEVEECLQSLHSISKIFSSKLKVVCQVAECQDEDKKVHYLTTERFDDGSVQALVVCDNDDLKPRGITLEEAYWFSCELPLATHTLITLGNNDNPKLLNSASSNEKDGQQLSSKINCQNNEDNNVDGELNVSSNAIVKVPQVYRLLRHNSTDWNSFGRELGVKYDFREELRRDSSLSNGDRLEKVLIKWVESECSEVSWETIMRMLKFLELNDIVKQVKDYLLYNQQAVTK